MDRFYVTLAFLKYSSKYHLKLVYIIKRETCLSRHLIKFYLTVADKISQLKLILLNDREC